MTHSHHPNDPAAHDAHEHPREPGYPEHPEAHAGHDKHAGHSVAMFRRKFSLSLLLTIPTLVCGEIIPRVLGFTPPAIPAARWIPVIVGTAV